MAVEVAIVRGILARLAALSLSPALPIASPNVALLSLPVDISELRFSAFRQAARTSGINAFNRHEGIAQIDVNYPQNGGEPAVMTMAVAVKDHFAIGTVITQDGWRIRVLSPPWMSSLQFDSPRVFIPVNVPYVCDEI